VDSWVLQLGLDPSNYGTHTLRRTKATLIYRRTKNLRAVQLLLGHTKLDYLQSRTMSRRAVMRFIINTNEVCGRDIVRDLTGS
jgi:integrase